MPIIDVVPNSAAQAVLVLAAVSRGQAVLPDDIGHGTAFCDYLASQLQDAPKSETAWEFPSTRAKRLDRESLLVSGVTLDHVTQVRQHLLDVQQGQRGKDVKEIQRFLVEVTGPMRVRRARERREARRRRLSM